MFVASRGAGAREIHGNDPGLFVLEVVRRVIGLRAVDHRSEIDRLLPTKVVMLVAASRNIHVRAAEASRTKTAKEQPVPVGREIGSIGVAADAIMTGTLLNASRL